MTLSRARVERCQESTVCLCHQINWGLSSCHPVKATAKKSEPSIFCICGDSEMTALWHGHVYRTSQSISPAALFLYSHSSLTPAETTPRRGSVWRQSVSGADYWCSGVFVSYMWEHRHSKSSLNTLPPDHRRGDGVGARSYWCLLSQNEVQAGPVLIFYSK